tara:strand:+ start:1326 stop:2483 length:1158 start_codon:yes stop_codon:yes gene_type:complete
MKKVTVVTTSRADYGIFYPLLKEFSNDDELNLELLISGSHLSKDYGNTFSEIKADGIKKYSLIDVLKKTTFGSNQQSLIVSETIKKFSEYFSANKPDIIVLLGDRFEVLGVAISALLNKIPIAHIHGGEKTVGAIDDSLRHSITKLSHLHFVSCDDYKKRVEQLGEDPNNIFSVGSLGVQNVLTTKILPRNELKQTLKIRNEEGIFLVSYHPTTLSTYSTQKELEILLSVVREHKNKNIIFTGSNIDVGGADINNTFKAEVSKQFNCYYFNSLGRKLFLSLMYHCELLIGNSSSGIIEAPSFKKPVINIGIRQKGRVRAKNVIDVELNREQIRLAIVKATSDGFKKQLEHVRNPYEKENVSKTIVKIIKSVSLDRILYKNFIDIH